MSLMGMTGFGLSRQAGKSAPSGAFLFLRMVELAGR